MSDPRPAELDVTKARESVWSRLSVVWIVPLVALLVSLGVAWQSYRDRGVLVEVLFDDATGISVGQTVLRYREVEVGAVEAVSFTDDLQQVVVGVRVDQDVARFIDEDAQFWLVTPQVTVSGVSRLDTVLSGVFIEGAWDSEPGTLARRFDARDGPPAVRSNERGTIVTLRAEDGGTLSEGAPVYFRGVETGRLSNLRLAPGGDGVLIDAFVAAPHNARLSSATVFWDISGFSVTLGTEGLALDVASIASLVQGGVAFTTTSSGGRQVSAGQEFRLHPDEATARNSLFSDALQARVTLTTLLDESVRGLSIGAPVIYRGQRVGQVTDMSLNVAVDPGTGRVVRERIDFALSPERLGLSATAGLSEVMDFLRDEVDAGLRARVAATGLLGGTQVLELAAIEGMPAGTIDMEGEPFPVLPDGPPDVADVQAAAQDVLSRIAALPVEELMGSATRLMQEATRLIERDGAQETPAAVLALIEDVRALVRSPGVQAAPESLRATLSEAQGLLADLRAAEIDVTLTAALVAAEDAANSVSAAVEGIPDLVETLDTVAARAGDLPLADTVAEAQAVLARIETLLGADDTAALPGRLGGALDQITGALSDLRQGGAVDNVNAALGSAREAADAVAAASDDLPALVDRLDAAVADITGTLAAYGERSTFNNETLAALREVRRAAESVGSLARTLERNPNSIILGR